MFRRPIVAILSTGNEVCCINHCCSTTSLYHKVVEPGCPLKPGQVYDSNRYTLLSAVRENGYIAIDLGIARDT